MDLFRDLDGSFFFLDFMTLFADDTLLGRHKQDVRQILLGNIPEMGKARRVYRSRRINSAVGGTLLKFSLLLILLAIT